MLDLSNSLYKIEWLDLVFKNRNQAYGAYALRAQSAGHTLRALFIAAPLFVLFFISPKIYHFLYPVQHLEQAQMPVEKPVEVNMAPMAEPPKPAASVEQPRIKPVKEKAQAKLKTVKLPAHPKVVVSPTDIEPPTLEELNHAAVGSKTQDGEATNLSSLPSEGSGNDGLNGSGAGKGEGAGDELVDLVFLQSYPEFEGGMPAWAKYLQRNLHYPDMAQRNNVQGKVYISFVVEKDGAVSDVRLVKGVGYGLDEEAIRVISKSPKWKPGMQNGRSVRVKYTIPISFVNL